MKKKISRVIAFLKRYIKHPVYVAVYASVYFLKGFAFRIRFYSDEEIIDLLKSGKSVIRLGDGDIVHIQFGFDNAYHRPDNRLKKMYRTIISDYAVMSPYILSVPRFVNYTNLELKNLGERKLEWGLAMKVMFFLGFKKNVPYMDAHNFYYDNYFEQTVAPLFINKKAIFVTNKNTIKKQKENKNLPWQDAIYVESPESNAMDKYEEIKKNLDLVLVDSNKKDVVIFAAMGPVGKYLVYEYANRGYQGVDIGKVSEVMFTGESIQYLI